MERHKTQEGRPYNGAATPDTANPHTTTITFTTTTIAATATVARLASPPPPPPPLVLTHLVLVNGDTRDIRPRELGDVAVRAADAAPAVQHLRPGADAQAATQVVLVPLNFSTRKKRKHETQNARLLKTKKTYITQKHKNTKT